MMENPAMSGRKDRNNTGKSTNSWATEEESIDIDDLNEKMQSFSQSLLELNAIKANLRSFKEKIALFVEKRTQVMVTLNRLSKSIAENDPSIFKLTEKHKLALKHHELRARNICINIQQEKGPDVKVIEFFDDQIKKYEFQLGITPGILEASLVRENQRLQEQIAFQHKQPNIDERVDTLDLGSTAPTTQASLPQQSNNPNQSVFAPPNKINKVGVTMDQNQTIKIGMDATMLSGRNPQVIQPGVQPVNDTVNNTMAAIVAQMEIEPNDNSDTGGYNDRNEEWLDEKGRQAAAMDIGGPGGTGSSSASYSKQKQSNADGPKSIPIRSYMEAQNQDMNTSSASRARRQRQLEGAVPAQSEKHACANCNIF